MLLSPGLTVSVELSARGRFFSTSRLTVPDAVVPEVFFAEEVSVSFALELSAFFPAELTVSFVAASFFAAEELSVAFLSAVLGVVSGVITCLFTTFGLSAAGLVVRF